MDAVARQRVQNRRLQKALPLEKSKRVIAMVVRKNENNIPRTGSWTPAKPLQSSHALSRGNRAAHGTQNYGSPIHGFSFRASIKTLPVADGIRIPSRRAAVGATSRLRM